MPGGRRSPRRRRAGSAPRPPRAGWRSARLSMEAATVRRAAPRPARPASTPTPSHAPTRRTRRRTPPPAADGGRAAGSPMAVVGSARSARPPWPRLRAARGRRYEPLKSFSHDPDLGLERDAEVVRTRSRVSSMSALMSAGGRPAPVDDEVGVLGRDLGAVEPLALEAHLLDEPARGLARRDSSTRSRRRPGRAAGSPSSDLSRCLMSFWISASGRRWSCRRAPISTGPAGAANTR